MTLFMKQVLPIFLRPLRPNTLVLLLSDRMVLRSPALLSSSRKSRARWPSLSLERRDNEFRLPEMELEGDTVFLLSFGEAAKSCKPNVLLNPEILRYKLQ